MSSRAEMAARRADRDGDLVEALRRRDPVGAECLVSRYGERAYRLAARIAPDAQVAEDVVQQALLTAVDTIETFRGESSFASWLYGLVTRAAHERLRDEPGRRRELSLDDVLPVFDEDGRHVAPMTDWTPRVDYASVQTELRAALTSAIAALPDTYRAALVMRDVEGLSDVDVADALGLDVADARRRVHRARLFVRQHATDAMTALGTTPRIES